MNKPLDDYEAGVARWRAALKRNKKRSVIVIALFILIYLALGFLIDL